MRVHNNFRDGWVLGGIERNSNNCFLVPVAVRDAATMVHIIQQYVLPGTLIITDEWRAYSSLSNLGYGHQTVNHSQQFVNPINGAHTQNVVASEVKI